MNTPRAGSRLGSLSDLDLDPDPVLTCRATPIAPYPSTARRNIRPSTEMRLLSSDEFQSREWSNFRNDCEE